MMRVLQTVGAADLEPRFSRMNGWSLIAPNGQPFVSLTMLGGETDQGWRGDYQFDQPDFESSSRGLLAAIDKFDLWLGWQVDALDQTEEYATVDVIERTTGATWRTCTGRGGGRCL